MEINHILNKMDEIISHLAYQNKLTEAMFEILDAQQKRSAKSFKTLTDLHLGSISNSLNPDIKKIFDAAMEAAKKTVDERFKEGIE